jgi:hypothetical protein
MSTTLPSPTSFSIIHKQAANHQTQKNGTMNSQVPLQTWQADVRALLHQLCRGPLLEDALLRNLGITFPPPSPIRTSQLVRDHLSAFLEARDGRELIWDLDFKKRNVILDPEDWPLRISSESTSSCIGQCVDGLRDQIWGKDDYKIKMSESLLTTSQSPIDHVTEMAVWLFHSIHQAAKIARQSSNVPWIG